MSETDAELTDPRQIASTTFAYLRRIENQLGKMMEVLLRHETRLGRVERDIGEVKRDVGEVKSDIVMLENRVLTQMNEVLSVVQRVDEHPRRLDAVNPSASESQIQ
jgi:archaellum component FlaC